MDEVGAPTSLHAPGPDPSFQEREGRAERLKRQGTHGSYRTPPIFG